MALALAADERFLNEVQVPDMIWAKKFQARGASLLGTPYRYSTTDFYKMSSPQNEQTNTISSSSKAQIATATIESHGGHRLPEEFLCAGHSPVQLIAQFTSYPYAWYDVNIINSQLA